jgi:hypothetical protein
MKNDGRLFCLALAIGWMVLVGIIVIFILTR